MKEFIYSTGGIILTTAVELWYKNGRSNFEVQELIYDAFNKAGKEHDDETHQYLDAADMLHYNLERNNGRYNMNEKPFID